MSGIILSCKADKIVNSGLGGYQTKTVIDETINTQGKKIRTHKHMQTRERVKGSDYIVFTCPGCFQRNKKSIYDAKGRAGNSLSFKCHSCYREVEVSRPSEPVVTPQLVGPGGNPIT
jgi:hypothetical protein